MNQIKKMSAFLCGAMTFSMLVTGCGTTANISDTAKPASEIFSETEAVTNEIKETSSAIEDAVSNVSNLSTDANAPYSIDVTALFSDRDLSGDYTETASIILNGSSADIAGSGASADGSVITVTEEGVYRISGTLDDGQIIVNTEGKVQLVLDNADISCFDSSAIYVENAKKTFITLAANSKNSISDGETYPALTEENNAPDAAIYSKDSLTINGTGSLTVSGNYNEGITSKDDLVICNAEIQVNSVGHGLKGKDYVAITGADIAVTAGGDGIKSSNSKDAGMGFVYINSGNFEITAEGDGIQAETELVIRDGVFSVTAGGGIANAEPHTDNFGMGGGFGAFGRGGGWFTDAETSEEDSSVSTKGLKAGSLLYISGGTLEADAADDTLHSNGTLYIAGGSMTLKAGSKGIHADTDAVISDGEVIVTESYEGIEAANILVSGGNISVTSSDDGFNASDGPPEGAAGRAVDCSIEIIGGSIYVNADGDGLDSNGSMTISGGIVLIDGPESSGDGALDANSDIICSGGLLIAAGSVGMAEYPDGPQNTIVLTTNDQQGGTLVTICDSNGTEVLSYAPSKRFGSFIISCPDFTSNETYTIYLGGTSTAAQVNGLYAVGDYQADGTEEGAVTLDDTVSFIGESRGFGMGGGMMGGRGGQQIPDGDMKPGDFDRGNFDRGDFNPDDMEFPTDENGNTIQPDFGGRKDFDENMQPPTDENGNFSMPEDRQGGGHMGGGRDGFIPGGEMQNN